MQEIDVANLVPRLEEEYERLTAIEDLKKVLIGPFDFQVIKLGTFLSKAKEENLVAMLSRSINLFSWALAGMLGIDTRMVFHHLAMDSTIK